MHGARLFLLTAEFPATSDLRFTLTYFLPSIERLFSPFQSERGRARMNIMRDPIIISDPLLSKGNYVGIPTRSTKNLT